VPRDEEIRQLLSLAPDEVSRRAGSRLVVCDTLDDLHRHFAEAVADEIRGAAAESRSCNLILPVGPTGGYPPLVEIIRGEAMDLSHCHFFFMDEYEGDDGRAVPRDHPLSFKGVAEELFLGPLGAAAPPAGQVIFPDEANVHELAGMIAAAGGLDACFGGVGIHGHVAFNEPEPGVAASGPRRVRLNDFTVTINAVRAGVGGNLECFPRHAFTLGMTQILRARRIVLYVRNGCEFDWANTVLRLALFGEPGEDYPVTLVRNCEYTIVTDSETLATPAHLI
jgi:glucosamine-6-phosphate deaminase